MNKIKYFKLQKYIRFSIWILDCFLGVLMWTTWICLDAFSHFYLYIGICVSLRICEYFMNILSGWLDHVRSSSSYAYIHNTWPYSSIYLCIFDSVECKNSHIYTRARGKIRKILHSKPQRSWTLIVQGTSNMRLLCEGYAKCHLTLAP